MTHRVAGPPAPEDLPETFGEPAGFWVDLAALRAAFLTAGFTERLIGDPDRPRAALMSRSPAGAHDALVPLQTTTTDWPRRAREAIGVLEQRTGRPHLELGALTSREAALWQVIAEVRAVLDAHSCDDTHVVRPDGSICHPDPRDPGRVDLFAHGRCEMRHRVSARLEHLLAGGQ